MKFKLLPSSKPSQKDLNMTKRVELRKVQALIPFPFKENTIKFSKMTFLVSQGLATTRTDGFMWLRSKNKKLKVTLQKGKVRLISSMILDRLMKV